MNSNDSKKHFVFLAEHLSFGGAERSLVEILANIDTQKFDVTLVVRDDRGSENVFLKDIPDKVKIEFIYPQNELLPPARGFRERVDKFFRKKNKKYDLKCRFEKVFAKIGRIDLIIDYTSVLIKQAHYFRQYKKIYWIHGPKAHMGKAELAKFNLRLKSYDLIAVVSKYLKDELEGLLPNLKGKVVALYNPFDFARIQASANLESSLSDEDKKLIGEKYILAVGRFALEKDYQNLIEAYRILKRNGFLPKLYIIGDGSERKNIEAIIETNSLQDDVLLLGGRANPYVWMKNSQMFVHSANVEGFGLVIVEAMVLGKAVVVTDCPFGPKEILDGGKYGVLVPPKDPTALSHAILEVINDRNYREKLESKAFVRSKEYSVEIVMPEMYKVFEAVSSR